MTKLAEKAFQIAVVGSGAKQSYLAAAATQHAAELMLVRDAKLPPKPRFELERLARQYDIERHKLRVGEFIRLG